MLVKKVYAPAEILDPPLVVKYNVLTMQSHSEERPYRCYVEDCNTVFKSEVTLKKHIK